MNGHTLGLDLSLTETGWATVTADGTHQCGVVRTDAKDPLGARLNTITTGIDAAVDWQNTRLAVVEKPFNAAFGIEPAKVFGVVIHQLGLAEIPTAEIPPSSLKVFACGNGSGRGAGSKIGPAIQAAQRLRYAGDNHNEVDALWLATLGWHLLGNPVVDLPATHTRALAAPWAKGWPGHTPPPPKARKKKAAA